MINTTTSCDMSRFLFCLSGLLLAFAAQVHAAGHVVRAYTADLTPIPGTDSGVTGTVTVFLASDDTTAYAGSATGLTPDLGPVNCTAVNGCGVHIHAGDDCTNTTTQMGHFFVDPVMEDPWTEDRYSTNAEGVATFAGIVTVGTDDIDGLAFIVHGQGGERLACGLLSEADVSYVVQTDPLGDSGVESSVTTVVGTDGPDHICLYGSATGLEPSLMSFLAGGDNCTAANGCGAHVHAGTDCTNSTTQMGHYYNADILAEDPWKYIGYLSTDEEGVGHFVDCAYTGENTFDGNAFIVHANDGSRVSCGLLEPFDPDVGPAPTQSPDAPDDGAVSSLATAWVAVATLALVAIL